MSYHLWSSFFIYHSPQIISLSCPLYSEQVTESVFARSGEWFSNLNVHQNHPELRLEQTAGPTPRVSSPIGPGQQKICIANELPAQPDLPETDCLSSLKGRATAVIAMHGPCMDHDSNEQKHLHH